MKNYDKMTDYSIDKFSNEEENDFNKENCIIDDNDEKTKEALEITDKTSKDMNELIALSKEYKKNDLNDTKKKFEDRMDEFKSDINSYMVDITPFETPESLLKELEEKENEKIIWKERKFFIIDKKIR